MSPPRFAYFSVPVLSAQSIDPPSPSTGSKCVGSGSILNADFKILELERRLKMLELENKELRLKLNEADSKVRFYEDNRERFEEEDVFDIVNRMHLGGGHNSDRRARSVEVLKFPPSSSSKPEMLVVTNVGSKSHVALDHMDNVFSIDEVPDERDYVQVPMERG